MFAVFLVQQGQEPALLGYASTPTRARTIAARRWGGKEKRQTTVVEDNGGVTNAHIAWLVQHEDGSQAHVVAAPCTPPTRH